LHYHEASLEGPPLIRRSLAVLSLLAAAMPLHAANKDMERLYLQVATLQGQVADLQRIVEDSLREVKRLNDMLAEQNALAKTGTQDRRAQEEAVQNALRELTERVADMDERLRAAPPAAAPAPLPAPGVPGALAGDGTGVPPADQPPPAPAPAASPRELYSQAYADYARGNYDLALQEYQEYRRLFPDTDLGDNAQYWIGECYYAKKQYPQAVEAWNELLRQYPSSDKLPDARFKKAVALERLGRRREAMTEYRQVVERYPNSEAGRKAREKLAPE
jgi:tol-pal system protein YbgF